MGVYKKLLTLLLEFAQESKLISLVWPSLRKTPFLKDLIFANLRDRVNTLVGPLSGP